MEDSSPPREKSILKKAFTNTTKHHSTKIVTASSANTSAKHSYITSTKLMNQYETDTATFTTYTSFITFSKKQEKQSKTTNFIPSKKNFMKLTSSTKTRKQRSLTRELSFRNETTPPYTQRFQKTFSQQPLRLRFTHPISLMKISSHLNFH